MKKLLILIVLLGFGTVKAQISDVRVEGSNINVYDENDKRIMYLTSGSSAELLGFSSKFFVILENGYIKTYDENCKNLGYISAATNKFISATGSTFIVENSSGYRDKYDMYCKRK